MNKLIIVLIAFLLSSFNSFTQDRKKEERLKIAKEFALAFRQDLSNEEIIKKYSIDGHYFTVDSIRKNADDWMTLMKEWLKEADNIHAIKYSEHKNEYAVAPYPGQPKRKLKIYLHTFGPKKLVELEFKENNFYVIKFVVKTKTGKNESGRLFIIFNDENKIISFASYQAEQILDMIQW